MLQIILTILLITAITIFSIRRHITYLHIFQQQEYYAARFLRWVISNLAFDKRLTSILCLICAVNYYKYIAFIIAIFVFTYLEKNPFKSAKKKLVFTARAKRIYYLSLFINLFANLILLFNLCLQNYFIFLLLAIQLIPIYITLAHLLLIPLENHFQQQIWQEAKQKIFSHKPFIIGITGSFGKTSVKHILGHILGQTDHTLITGGSINTVMGISRVIREELNTMHKYFIVEMGAYGIGSINKICQLTPPNFGIITAIGAAHYERFKNLETVANAKFELADAIINNSQDNKNRIVIPAQVLNTEYAKQYLQKHQQYFSVLESTQIPKITQLKSGLAIDLQLDNIIHHIDTPIFGLHNVNNICVAFIAAKNLGIPIPVILAALKTTPQTPHRLEVKKQNNYTIIDDAYNANPEGFRSALELLSFLNDPPGRRILVTPGLIELGTKHNSEHFLLGEIAAKHADIAVIVNPNRIKSFVSGFKKHITDPTKIVTFASFNEAQQWLKINCQSKDTILLANDLPDLYEGGLKI